MNAESLSGFRDAVSGGKTSFFSPQRRRAALERFEAMGLPKPEWESWRRTDVSDLSKISYSPARLLPLPESLPRRHHLPGATVLLTFVNGFFVPSASDIAHLPEGVEAGPLASRPDVSGFGEMVSLEGAPFAALNTALFPDGAYVRVTPGTVSEPTVHLLFLTLPDTRPVLATPRVFLQVGENSHMTVVETHAGGNPGHLSAAVTEGDVGPSGRLHHIRRVFGLAEGAHVGHVQVRQARSSFFGSVSLVFGGNFVRNEIRVAQAGEGAETSLEGVVLARDRDRVDHQTSIDHAASRGLSREIYKYLLDGRARGVFNGEVLIRPGAQKVDASQSNINLLLSDDALVHTKPDMKIFADDVKAKHGASIGRLDNDMIFYGRSRGLSVEETRRMLLEAFASDILGRIPCPAAREDAVSAAARWWGVS